MTDEYDDDCDHGDDNDIVCTNILLWTEIIEIVPN
jgi:hypothetical protein